MFNPTPQQDNFRRWVVEGQGSANLEAVAGSGKTTTVVWATQFMPGKVALLAYNKKIAEELQRRVTEPDRITAGTFHSFGLRALKKMDRSVMVKANKLDSLTRRDPEWMLGYLRKAVSLAKQHLLMPDDQAGWEHIVEHYALEETLGANTTYAPDALRRAQQVLFESNQDRRQIDFDDMIYLPATLGYSPGQFDWVLIDEAQDTNPARRALAELMLKPGGRLVAVGDPHQAIYGFTGADADSLDLLRERFKSERLPLTVSFRCPKAVVRLAQQFVHHIESAPDAPEGKVTNVTLNDLFNKPDGAFRRGDAMICRLTKPLVSTAYQLIARGIPCHIEGRDIGQGIISLIKKVQKGCGAAIDLMTFMPALQEYEEKRTARLLEQEKDREAERLADQCEVIRVIAQNVTEGHVSALIAQVNKLFSDTTEDGSPNFTLSTVHKAKGREWDRVYLLGRGKFMPSRWAKQPWELAQETNLIYVAVTRAKQELIEVAVS